MYIDVRRHTLVRVHGARFGLKRFLSVHNQLVSDVTNKFNTHCMCVEYALNAFG